MRRASLLLAALGSLAAACGDTVGDTTLDIVYDPCERIALVPQDDATAGELAAIDAAAALWRGVIDTELARGDGAIALPIRFEDAAGAFRGVYLDEEGVVVVNRQLDGSPIQTIALAHELGHAFGLWHVDEDERVSVMNHGNTDVVPNDGDAAAIEALWGDCGERRDPPATR